jgi:hypothetical protein
MSDSRRPNRSWRDSDTILETIINKYGSNSSSQNRLVRWRLPLAYKQLFRPSRNRCGTSLTNVKYKFVLKSALHSGYNVYIKMNSGPVQPSELVRCLLHLTQKTNRTSTLSFKFYNCGRKCCYSGCYSSYSRICITPWFFMADSSKSAT